MQEASIEEAARAIENADALLIGAGAGMGVDSGLPDFRGSDGFWRAYPPFQGRTFAQVANAGTFAEDPGQAWGFYGHRLNLYRDTVPHEGFQIIRRLIQKFSRDHFVYTSNVDGQFQKAGFDEERLVECHGSLHHLQCAPRCGSIEIWSAHGIEIEVDRETFRARGPLPTCPACGGMARPNVLMFGDFAWNPRRTSAQETNYQKWLARVSRGRVVAIEFGAGTAIPTVRYECQRRSNKLIRVNPRDFQVPEGAISLRMTALDALRAIEERLTNCSL
ncbi:MAG: NAD-dependent protein deacetylase [Candidatus Melainabacteria bacterium]|nr:NAD-dependent protein deacetylase [Candidatus Melainabacteria bacterium]